MRTAAKDLLQKFLASKQKNWAWPGERVQHDHVVLEHKPTGDLFQVPLCKMPECEDNKVLANILRNHHDAESNILQKGDKVAAGSKAGGKGTKAAEKRAAPAAAPKQGKGNGGGAAQQPRRAPRPRRPAPAPASGASGSGGLGNGKRSRGGELPPHPSKRARQPASSGSAAAPADHDDDHDHDHDAALARVTERAAQLFEPVSPPGGRYVHAEDVEGSTAQQAGAYLQGATECFERMFPGARDAEHAAQMLAHERATARQNVTVVADLEMQLAAANALVDHQQREIGTAMALLEEARAQVAAATALHAETTTTTTTATPGAAGAAGAAGAEREEGAAAAEGAEGAVVVAEGAEAPRAAAATTTTTAAASPAAASPLPAGTPYPCGLPPAGPYYGRFRPRGDEAIAEAIAKGFLRPNGVCWPYPPDYAACGWPCWPHPPDCVAIARAAASKAAAAAGTSLKPPAASPSPAAASAADAPHDRPRPPPGGLVDHPTAVCDYCGGGDYMWDGCGVYQRLTHCYSGLLDLCPSAVHNSCTLKYSLTCFGLCTKHDRTCAKHKEPTCAICIEAAQKRYMTTQEEPEAQNCGQPKPVPPHSAAPAAAPGRGRGHSAAPATAPGRGRSHGRRGSSTGGTHRVVRGISKHRSAPATRSQPPSVDE